MGSKTKIEWSSSTWTPVRARHLATGKVGWHCEHVSPGCVNCYSEALNRRFGTGLDFKPSHRRDIEIVLDERMLMAPLRWKRPRQIFVCSMTDLFGDFVPDEWINAVFAAMALAPQHTFQVLTKRPRRMRRWISETPNVLGWTDFHTHQWPLPNVHLGVSCEDQARADERIPDLLATPAAVRWVSLEPLLGPINLRPLRTKNAKYDTDEAASVYALDGKYQIPGSHWSEDHPRLDWVVAGGESGPGWRLCPVSAFYSLRDQCAAAGVPFFMKQMPGKLPIPAELLIRQYPKENQNDGR